MADQFKPGKKFKGFKQKHSVCLEQKAKLFFRLTEKAGICCTLVKQILKAQALRFRAPMHSANQNLTFLSQFECRRLASLDIGMNSEPRTHSRLITGARIFNSSNQFSTT